MARAKRKLAPTLSADVVGYACLMADNAAAIVEILTEYCQIFADHIARHDGHVVDSPGITGSQRATKSFAIRRVGPGSTRSRCAGCFVSRDCG